MAATAVTWMSLTDAAVGEGDADGPAGISEDDGAGDDDADWVGDPGVEVAGTRASGKQALAVISASSTRANTWPRRTPLTLRRMNARSKRVAHTVPWCS